MTRLRKVMVWKETPSTAYYARHFYSVMFFISNGLVHCQTFNSELFLVLNLNAFKKFSVVVVLNLTAAGASSIFALYNAMVIHVE